MFDPGQILIVTAISIMTIILTVIGVQLIFILRDFRRIMNKANNALNALEGFGISLTSGTAELIGFVAGVKKVLSVMEHLSEREKAKNGKKK